MIFNQLATQEVIDQTITSLTQNGFQPVFISTKNEALNFIKENIPQGASVMNGASATLQEIGFIDYLKTGEHGWNNLHANILAETDPEKQSLLRKESVLSDFYLGSVHALSKTGEMVIASNTGSQLPHLAFTSQNIILVVSTQKITHNLEQAFQRVEEYVIPLEDARMMEAYKSHTQESKTLILHKENPNLGRKVQVLLVNEKLGF